MFWTLAEDIPQQVMLSHAYISDANSSGLLDFGNGTTDVSFSFAFWFKPDAGGTSDYRYLFSKYAVVLGDAQGYYRYYGDENATTSNRRGSLFISQETRVF